MVHKRQRSAVILTDYSAKDITSDIVTKEHYRYSLHSIFIRGIIKLFTVQEHTCVHSTGSLWLVQLSFFSSSKVGCDITIIVRHLLLYHYEIGGLPQISVYGFLHPAPQFVSYYAIQPESQLLILAIDVDVFVLTVLCPPAVSRILSKRNNLKF